LQKVILILPLLIFLGGCDLFVDPEIKREFEEHKKLGRAIDCMPSIGEDAKKKEELCEYAHKKGYGNYAE